MKPESMFAAGQATALLHEAGVEVTEADILLMAEKLFDGDIDNKVTLSSGKVVRCIEAYEYDFYMDDEYDDRPRWDRKLGEVWLGNAEFAYLWVD